MHITGAKSELEAGQNYIHTHARTDANTQAHVIRLGKSKKVGRSAWFEVVSVVC